MGHGIWTIMETESGILRRAMCRSGLEQAEINLYLVNGAEIGYRACNRN